MAVLQPVRIGADWSAVCHRLLLLLLGAVLATAGAGCDSQDGRQLPAPSDDQTTTSVSTPVIGTQSGDPAAAAFALTSPDFADGGGLPERFTCAAGPGAVNPGLSWTGTPPAAELALVVADAADGTPVWVLAGIDPATTGFGTGGQPEAAISNGWQAPCPPAGQTHSYTFTLHALPEPLVLVPGTPDDQARSMIEGVSSDRATLTATATG